MTFDELNNLKAVARKYGGLNLGEVDQLIDTAERHLASAEQVRQMREVLGKLEAHRRQYPESMWESLLKDQQSNAFSYRIGEKYVTHVPAMLFEEIRQALTLTETAAEQQAKENAEKAALLEWWFDEANEEARERIRFERWASDSPWTAEQWIDAVSKVKETPNAK
jgi:hypothetical protein